MSQSSQELYELLPAIHRLRDAENNEALKAYLDVFAEQISVLQENIDQLYDDQFIETCAEWMVPYIGDLIGYKPLHTKVTKALSQRAEVANTIAYRRRKGTATMLEQLARDVTAWPARVVEFFQLLATTQYMNHTRLHNHYAPALLDWQALQNIDTAFDSTVHTVDVRHIDTDSGKFNIKNIGIYLWRLQSYSLTQNPLLPIAPGRYFLSPLQHDIPLFNLPIAESEITHLAEPQNVPHEIKRRVMDAFLHSYYGVGKSIALFTDTDPAVEGLDLIPESIVRVCCLANRNGDWINEPQDELAEDGITLKSVFSIDPENGRLAIPPHMQAEAPALWASYYYGFSANIGGGEYERASAFDNSLPTVTEVRSSQSIQSALDSLAGEGVIEISDSARYVETLSINVNAASRIELRGDNEHRPLVVLDSNLEIRGAQPVVDALGGVVTLDGLLISGGSLIVPELDNGIRILRLRHCTLVPGISLNESGEAVSPEIPSLIIESDQVKVEIDHCILGGIRAVEDAEIEISNSIIDANNNSSVAFAALDALSAGAELTIVNTTVIGKLHTRIMQLASNCIFDASLATADAWPSPVIAERKQEGCVRFSYVPITSRLPRRYRCQPELAIQQLIKKENAISPSSLSSSEKAQLTQLTINRLVPSYTDTRYGQPAYMQLAKCCPKEIKTGADDESEMGVFHDLYQPRRETNLKLRLKEYLRFGLEAGIFYET